MAGVTRIDLNPYTLKRVAELAIETRRNGDWQNAELQLQYSPMDGVQWVLYDPSDEGKFKVLMLGR